MRLLFAGSPATAVVSLNALLADGHDIVAVATNPDARTGRGRHLAVSPVAAAAAAFGIPLLQPVRARDPWFAQAVNQLEVDAAVIVAWGTLIPDALLGVPKHGWVNLHFSLLPAWRGAAPVQRALMAGDTTSGVSTFRLVHDLDAGPWWRQQSTTIGQDENAGELLGRLAEIGAACLVRTLGDIASGIEPSPQAATGLSLAPKVGVEDARLTWTQPAVEIHNQVRGTTPAPGAWTTLRGQRLKIQRTALAQTDGPTMAPGELFATRTSLLAGTGDGRIQLVSVQSVGKPPLAGADWARGAHLDPGVRCE